MFRWLQRMLFNRTWEEQQDLLLRKPLFPFSCSVVSDSLWPHGLQHARLLCASLSPGVCSNSCPLSWWCQFPTISSSAVPFSSCLQSFPATGSESLVIRALECLQLMNYVNWIKLLSFLLPAWLTIHTIYPSLEKVIL